MLQTLIIQNGVGTHHDSHGAEYLGIITLKIHALYVQHNSCARGTIIAVESQQCLPSALI